MGAGQRLVLQCPGGLNTVTNNQGTKHPVPTLTLTSHPKDLQMITQAQAQKHAEACGLSGIALPIPVSPDNLTTRYTLADNAYHVETQQPLANKGDTVTGFTLLCWAECFGLDYVTVV
jgi:hypothetical protein